MLPIVAPAMIAVLILWLLLDVALEFEFVSVVESAGDVALPVPDVAVLDGLDDPPPSAVRFT